MGVSRDCSFLGRFYPLLSREPNSDLNVTDGQTDEHYCGKCMASPRYAKHRTVKTKSPMLRNLVKNFGE